MVRYAQKKCLTEAYYRLPEFKKYLRYLMALALLPPALIASEWEKVKDEKFARMCPVEKIGLEALQGFFGTYWMVHVGPSTFSVWRIPDRYKFGEAGGGQFTYNS